MNYYKEIVLIAVLLLSGAGGLRGGEWYLSSSAQYTSGNYIYDQNTTATYLNNGIRYQTSKWNLSATIPLVAQSNDLAQLAGGMFLPGRHQTGQPHQGHGGMMDEDEAEMNHLQMGVGDLYLYANWEVSRFWSGKVSLSLNGQLKAPTATKSLNYGTGEWDFGAGFNFRYSHGTYSFLTEIGYRNIGDPDAQLYRNPLTIGAGIGKLLLDGKMSFLIYYQQYSEVIKGYQAPRQFSTGILYQLSPRLLLNASVLLGVSEISPDYALSLGFDLKL